MLKECLKMFQNKRMLKNVKIMLKECLKMLK